MKLPDSYRQKLGRPKPHIDERDRWIDPDSASPQGLILSDRILFYCEKVNLIWPFDDAYVEPASYTLHAGSEYLISRRPGQVESRNLEHEGPVVIPSNGLIYIRFLEEVCLPYYLIARFNLRVSQVYRGLLLGTGPQVDPGYNGLLGCPIHNFTDEEKIIEFFEPLVTIDFEKTTQLGESHTWSHSLKEQDFASMRAGVFKVPGINNLHCKIFNKRVNAPFQSFLPAGQSVRSSVVNLQEQVAEQQKFLKEQVEELRKFRRFSLLSGLGVTIGVLTIFVMTYFHIEGYVDRIKDNIRELTLEVGRIQGSVTANAASGSASKDERQGRKSLLESERNKEPEKRSVR